jgi:hypothetical protein
MRLRNLLRRWLSSPPMSPVLRRQQPGRFRPAVEALEVRLTPAHNITIATGGQMFLPLGAG